MAAGEDVVVTGVSTGIGLGITRVLTAHGLHVYGTVRRQTDSDRLREEFGNRMTTILMDVTDEAAVRRGAGEVAEQLGTSDFRSW